MTQPPALTEPPHRAPTPRKLTNRATETKMRPTVRSVAGTLTQFDRPIQQYPDSFKRTVNYLGARERFEPLHWGE
ncbi:MULTISPECIES: hypothetical protein [unclassified Microcoleus]|uniref:hypothetical protein n=1 Tax=unclassified Microcoleus TaxID=2642155 RepID=UPI0025FE43C9|nr:MULTISPECIES: hypothetical protein [unclassified Microcoleus]